MAKFEFIDIRNRSYVYENNSINSLGSMNYHLLDKEWLRVYRGQYKAEYLLKVDKVICVTILKD